MTSSMAVATPEVRTVSMARTPGGASVATPVPALDLSQLRNFSQKTSHSLIQNQSSKIEMTRLPTGGEKSSNGGIGSFK